LNGQRTVTQQVAEVSACYTIGTKKRKKPQSLPELDFDTTISKCVINYDVFIAAA
jgi:hypothetical protein